MNRTKEIQNKSFFKKFNLKKTSTYAKEHNVSREAVRLWIKQGKIDYVYIDGVKFIIKRK